MKSNGKELVKDILIMTFAMALIAAAVFFFLMPSKASVSSIAGLAIVLENFLPLSVSAITMIINVGLLVVGFLLCGKEFGAKTVYTSVLLPIFLAVLEKQFPNFTSLTQDAVLDVVAYIFLMCIGVSILFNCNASSGGLDIVAKIMNKYLHMEIGKAISLSGMAIALSSALAYDAKTVVISVLGTYFSGILLDHFIFDHNVKKRVCILTQHEDLVRNYILHDLKSGATIYEAIGAYDLTSRNEIITIVDKAEYQKLMNFIMKNDPEAFVTVYTVNEVIYQPKKLS